MRNPKSFNFLHLYIPCFSFRDLCTQGYLLLHYHRRFFVALFKMMRCMGLPELATDEDLNYLFTSLHYHSTEKEAVTAHFQDVFDNVAKTDFSTSVNWFFHSVKHHK